MGGGGGGEYAHLGVTNKGRESKTKQSRELDERLRNKKNKRMEGRQGETILTE